VSLSGVKGRPRGRPFAKGQSGNPGTRPIRPKTIELRKLEHDVRLSARDWGFEAIEKLVVLMRGVITVEIDKKRVEIFVPPMTQLAAANALLDRAMAVLASPSSYTAAKSERRSKRVARLSLLKPSSKP